MTSLSITPRGCLAKEEDWLGAARAWRGPCFVAAFLVLITSALLFLSVVDLAPCLQGAFTSASTTSADGEPRSWQPGTEALELEYSHWLEGYKAADPAYQDYCKSLLTTGEPNKNGGGVGSQFGQDASLFFNVFKYWPMQGRKGFYVDSGANDARELSNTLFFDKCLGWEGLCVEPQTRYHAGIKEHRSCILIPECISSTKQNVSISDEGSVGKVITADSGHGIPCSPLKDMLSRSGNASRRQVDLWSLDVEGYEMTVLQGVNFSEIIVNVMLIEDFWISTRDLDLLMTQNSFYKHLQLPIDALYIRRGMQIPSQETVWYPPQWEYWVKFHQQYRREQKDKLQCYLP